MRSSLDFGWRRIPARIHASLPRAFLTASVALTVMSLTPFTTAASAQPVAARPDSTVAVSVSTPGSATQNATATASTQPAAGTAAQPDDDRYRDGIVIWETPAGVKVAFLLKFNINTQIRYLNTQDSDETFTDHLGGVHDVHTRND